VHHHLGEHGDGGDNGDGGGGEHLDGRGGVLAVGLGEDVAGGLVGGGSGSRGEVRLAGRHEALAEAAADVLGLGRVVAGGVEGHGEVDGKSAGVALKIELN